MALSPTQQAFEVIKQSKSILIAFKSDWTGDALSSSLALSEFLKKLGKKTDIVCDGFVPPASLNFLPLADVSPKLNSLQKFVITVNTAQAQVGEFYYDQDGGKLNIYITPSEGIFNSEDVATDASDYRYDLIFIVNSPDLESLGGIYEKHPDFFYSIPKINIDHSNRNENFGNINLVSLTAASTAEIIYGLIKEYEENLIDENIATYLLTGIIMSTKNFKSSEVTPKTLNLASLLIAKGARREQIIQNLYQSRYLSTLKLWGRVLSRLNQDLDGRLVWSVLPAQDFYETSTRPDELPDVIEELIVSMPKTELVVLLYEVKELEHTEVYAIVYSPKNIDTLFVCQKFNAVGNRELAKFSLPEADLYEAERMIIEEIKQKMS